MINKKLLLFIFSCFFPVIFHCASLTQPGGGPDDKTGPEILISNPAPDATNISTDTKISFTFSEWISTKSVKCVSIFPPVKIRTKLFNNKLEIYPLTKLKDSTTYHIQITSTLQDLHSNPISPYNLIFSTGPDLDSGTLRGCIIDTINKSINYKIALFTDKDLSDSGASGSPSYLLQTDSTGRFNFKHLAINSYRVIAYIDKNNDEHLQSTTEPVFIPEDSTIFINKENADILFFPALYDTAFPYITNVKAINNKVIIADWNKIFDTLVFKTVSVSVQKNDNNEQVKNISYLPLTNSLSFAITTGSPIDITSYRMVYSVKRIFDNYSFNDTVLFNGTNAVDSVKPELKIKPDTGSVIDLNSPLKLIWSEPVKITSPLLLTNSSGDSVITTVSKGYSDTCFIAPVSRLRPGSVYSMFFTKEFAKDLYGNSILSKDSTDSTDTLRVKTIEADSMANSLQGSIPCSKPTGNLIWIYAPFNSQQKTQYSSDKSGSFFFDSIPAGKGKIGYFIDKNRNHVADNGRVCPWYSPEPLLFSTDTVEARARWDIEDITVQICDPCKPPAVEKDTTDNRDR